KYPDGGSWDGLRQDLKNANVGITNISNDPSCSDSNCDDNYQYFSDDGEQYVLQAFLEDKLSPIAKDSFGTGSNETYPDASCGRPVGDRIYYCIKF
ncbi:MAG: hypothetical protein Q7R62_00135, partial [bacterium]|nr:hypothetical protein [bacterium]